MLFILLYTPCLSTLATQFTESRSWKFTGISLTWSLSLAWIVSFIFYQGARALGY
jgi:ferrous iron transport protein B